MKDLLDAFYMQGGTREVVLYAITIDPMQPISMELSVECARAADVAAYEIFGELEAGSGDRLKAGPPRWLRRSHTCKSDHFSLIFGTWSDDLLSVL